MRWKLRPRIVAIGVVILTIGVPILINEAYKFNRGYLTVWGGSDVLAYFGTLIGSFGTFILGYIAWRQNERLLSIEKRSYLAENAGSAIVTELRIKGVRNIACNFDQHVEQVLMTDEKIDLFHFDYRTVSVECKLEPMDHTRHIALVRVQSILLQGFGGEGSARSIIEARNQDEKFSRVSISKGFDRFRVTIIISLKEFKDFVASIDNISSRVFINIELELLTDRYVATSLICKSTLYNPDFDEKEGIYSRFKTVETDPPQCFWSGVSLKDFDEVQIKLVDSPKHKI